MYNVYTHYGLARESICTIQYVTNFIEELEC